MPDPIHQDPVKPQTREGQPLPEQEPIEQPVQQPTEDPQEEDSDDETQK